MSRIHSKDTSIEIAVRKWLYHNGYRYRKNVKDLPGKDSQRSVIFSVVREDMVDEILVALENHFHTVNRDSGVAFTVPMTSVIGKLSYAFLSNDQRMLKE